MNQFPLRPLLFGEVLFDCFPDGSEVLGGAPFNVAWHLQAFGAAPVLITRVGADAAGARVAVALRDWGMDCRGLQHDPARATGRVKVSFDHGEPVYDIVTDSAWDAIQADALPAFEGRWLLYHGSLALRSAASVQALRQLRAVTDSLVYCDVNLRAPWYQVAQLMPLLHQATWIKLNAAELVTLAPVADTNAALRAVVGPAARAVLLTRGAEGAELHHLPEGVVLRVRPRQRGQVMDSVGAGDAFCSVMLLGLLRGWEPQLMLQRAQDFASRVVGLRGATTRDRDFYARAMHGW